MARKLLASDTSLIKLSEHFTPMWPAISRIIFSGFLMRKISKKIIYGKVFKIGNNTIHKLLRESQSYTSVKMTEFRGLKLYWTQIGWFVSYIHTKYGNERVILWFSIEKGVLYLQLSLLNRSYKSWSLIESNTLLHQLNLPVSIPLSSLNLCPIHYIPW